MGRIVSDIQKLLAAALAEHDAYLQQRVVALGELNEILRQRDVASRAGQIPSSDRRLPSQSR
jgi:hypothetical protein